MARHGMAWRTSKPQKRPLTSASSSERSSQSGPVILDMDKFASRTSPSKSGTGVFPPYWVGTRIRGRQGCHLSVCLSPFICERPTRVCTVAWLACLRLMFPSRSPAFDAQFLGSAHPRLVPVVVVACMCPKSYTKITHPCASAPPSKTPCPAMQVRNVWQW